MPSSIVRGRNRLDLGVPWIRLCAAGCSETGIAALVLVQYPYGMKIPPAGWLALDRRDGDLSGQIYRALRDRVLAGDLPCDAVLPSTRGLAAGLGVARATVVSAYEQLRAEGYVTGIVGSSTRIADLPRLEPRPSVAAAAFDPAVRCPTNNLFRPGIPDLDLFPHRIWARCLAARARSLRIHDLGYGDAAGLPALRSAILEHVAATRGVAGAPEQVVIVPSTSTAIALLGKRLLTPGDDHVWVEEPGYDTARRVLVQAGGRLAPMPVDRDGMTLAGGHRSPKVIYVTPSHQYPTGVTMSLPRRLALLEVARSAGAVVIEDDYDCEFLDGVPIAALKSIDRSGVVAYVGTFSKSLAPGLRIAYAILPTSLAADIAEQQMLVGAMVPIHTQAALADFIQDGHFRAHIRRTAAGYGRGIRALASAIQHRCGPLVRLDPARTGLQLAVWFTDQKTDDREVAKAMGRRGFAAAPLSDFYLGSASPGLLLGLSGAETRAAAVAQSLTDLLEGES